MEARKMLLLIEALFWLMQEVLSTIIIYPPITVSGLGADCIPDSDMV